MAFSPKPAINILYCKVISGNKKRTTSSSKLRWDRKIHKSSQVLVKSKEGDIFFPLCKHNLREIRVKGPPGKYESKLCVFFLEDRILH